MKTTREYLDELRLGLAKPRMTDAEVGAFFGVSQQAISSAKSKGMGVELALAVGHELVRLGRIAHTAEVVLSAQLEREHKRRSQLGAVLHDYWARHALPGQLKDDEQREPPRLTPPPSPRRGGRARASVRL